MREIEFKAKRKDNNEWIYGDLLQPTELCNTYEISDKNTIDGSRYDVDKETIGQYTGLKDKNGKKIFEGDIVKIHSHSFDFGFAKDRIGQIKYMDGSFGFYVPQSENEYLFNELLLEDTYGELDYYEVIGNIWENGDLLKEEI